MPWFWLVFFCVHSLVPINMKINQNLEVCHRVQKNFHLPFQTKWILTTNFLLRCPIIYPLPCPPVIRPWAGRKHTRAEACLTRRPMPIHRRARQHPNSCQAGLCGTPWVTYIFFLNTHMRVPHSFANFVEVFLVELVLQIQNTTLTTTHTTILT